MLEYIVVNPLQCQFSVYTFFSLCCSILTCFYCSTNIVSFQYDAEQHSCSHLLSPFDRLNALVHSIGRMIWSKNIRKARTTHGLTVKFKLTDLHQVTKLFVYKSLAWFWFTFLFILSNLKKIVPIECRMNTTSNALAVCLHHKHIVLEN